MITLEVTSKPETDHTMEERDTVRTIHVGNRQAPTSNIITFAVYKLPEGAKCVADYFCSEKGKQWYGNTTISLAFESFPNQVTIEQIRVALAESINAIVEQGRYSWFVEIVGDAVSNLNFGIVGHSSYVPD